MRRSDFVTLSVVCFLLTAVCTNAAAQIVDELSLTALDGVEDDAFGQFVDVSGGVAVVGAIARDEGGVRNTGAAYLFDVATGRQLRKLTASDRPRDNRDDTFGRAVAIYGNTVAVGAIWDDDIDTDSGAVYVFDVTTGEQRFKLTPEDLAYGDEFGNPLALDGDTLIVGSPQQHGLGIHHGAAYLFDATTGEQLLKLTLPDADDFDFFGARVAISGNLAAVSASNRSGLLRGVYVFDVTTGEQISELLAPDALLDDGFGIGLDISDNTVIVGSEYDNHSEIRRAGSAYLFDATSGELLHKLVATDAAYDDRFGRGVAIDGDIAIVGGVGDDDADLDAGSVYMFDVQSGNEIAKLIPGNARKEEFNGWDMAMDGGTIIVGRQRTVLPIPGSAYVYLMEMVGDTDGDSDVDDEDLNNVRNHFGSTGPDDGTLEGDSFPFDGVVDLRDLNHVRNRFGASAAPVPEPASHALAVVGLITLGTVRCRRQRLS